MKKESLGLLIVVTFLYSCHFFSNQNIPTSQIEFYGITEVQPVVNPKYQLSHKSGIYKNEFELTILSDSNISIYYSLNGKTPNPKKNYTHKYIKPIRITEEGLVKNKFYKIPTSRPGDWRHFTWHTPDSCRTSNNFTIQAFRRDSAVSKASVYTYFIQKTTHHSFPVIAITADPKLLWSQNKGMLVPGENLDTTNSNWSGNYFMDWKIPAHLEYFSTQGIKLYSTMIDMKVHGLKSPMAPQKSLRIYAKKKYGTDLFSYPFFKNDTITKQKRLILRTLFSCWGDRINSDIIISEIAKKFNVDIANSTPVILYLNGEYWGIENLRERIDKHYIAQHYQLNSDSIDIVLENQKAKTGSSKDYIKLCNYIKNNDLSIDSIYKIVIEHFDKESLIDYFILQTYFNNTDWPINNHVLWKSQKPNSKWRYLLYDLDATFADKKTNSIQNACIHPNLNKIINSTLVFGNLIKNESFKREFIEKYKLALETKLNEKEIIQVIDHFENLYAYDMTEHIDRWQYPVSYNEWLDKNEDMRKFVRARKKYTLEHLNRLKEK